MKKLMLIFLVLLIAVGLGIFMRENPSYVFITFAHTHIQTTLWFAILALLITALVLYQFVRLLRGIFRFPAHYRHFFAKRNEQKLHKLTQHGLCALLEGRWDKCEQYFLASAKKDAHPFFHYLAVAEAAFEQQKYQQRDEFLKKAQQVADQEETLALEITRGRWQLAAKEYQQALATFSLLNKIAPHHSFVLIGLQEVYIALGQWQELYLLLPKLRKYTQLDAKTLDRLEQQALKAMLEKAGELNSLPALEKSWESVPKKWRTCPEFLAIYAHYLIKDDQQEKAEEVLKAGLRKHHDAVLLEQYALVVSKDPAKQLARAELWLQRDANNPDLLFCLGRLCFRNRLWGKARTYLEASLKLKQRGDIYPILGEVLEQLGEKTEALACYRTGCRH